MLSIFLSAFLEIGYKSFLPASMLPFHKRSHADLLIIFKRNTVLFSTDYQNHQCSRAGRDATQDFPC